MFPSSPHMRTTLSDTITHTGWLCTVFSHYLRNMNAGAYPLWNHCVSTGADIHSARGNE